MRIKTLLTALALGCGLQSIAYGQQPEGNSDFHLAPPRKEIRHKLSGHPQDNDLPETAARASGEYIMKEFPTMGEIRGLVILAAFADVPFSVSADSIKTLLSNRFNAEGYSEEVKFNEYSDVFGEYLPLDVTVPGSARDYFKTQSFGQFVPSFDVVGPVTLNNDRTYYGANNSSGNDKNTLGMIRDACEKANSLGLTNFADYDYDKDGKVDIVFVVYAGCDEAQTGIEDAIWAKASSKEFTVNDSIKVCRYACSGELVVDLPVVAGIGTFVHEFSHVLGLPDFYNTKATDFTMDVWSVMDYGNYNAEGFVPCAYTAFERYSLGWIPMHTLDQPATMSIGTTEEEGKGYRIFTSNIDDMSVVTAADTASFYLVENIRKEGWNKYAPNNGLLISEVTYDRSAWRNNTVNSGSRHRHCIVPANNVYNYKNANKHLFGAEVVDKETQQVFINPTFTINSTPASITQFDATMDKPLTDIRYDEATGKTTFHFCGGSVEDGIEDITIQDSESRIHYDLLGRPVAHPSKGIYIMNGKKVIF